MTTFVTMPKGNSGEYSGGPLKAVDHTTETLSDPRNWIPGWASSSHEVWDYERDLVVRCVDLTLASKTLWNSAGGPQTNRDSAIQVEINGYAVNPADPARQNWPDAKYRWIAKQWARLQHELIDRGLGSIDFSDWRGDTTYGGSASEWADQRMGYDEWDDFNGICGHNNVPENDHWDPGLIDMAKLSRYILEELDELEPAEPEEEKDLSLHIHLPDNWDEPVGGTWRQDNGTGPRMCDFSYLPVGVSVIVRITGNYVPAQGNTFNAILVDGGGQGPVAAANFEPAVLVTRRAGRQTVQIPENVPFDKLSVFAREII